MNIFADHPFLTFYALMGSVFGVVASTSFYHDYAARFTWSDGQRSWASTLVGVLFGLLWLPLILIGIFSDRRS